MKRSVIGCLFVAVFLILAMIPATSQTPPANPKQAPAAQKAARPPENLPWTRFHRPDPPYQPTDAEKQQIQAKIDQLGGMIRELKAKRVDDGLLADVEIYHQAALWKMAYA